MIVKLLILNLSGFLLSILVDISKRNPGSNDSPYKFNLLFFLKDNWKRLIISISLSIVLILSYNVIGAEELIKYVLDISEVNEALVSLIAFGIGYAPDVFIGYIKRKYNIFIPKEVEIKNKTYKRKKNES